MFGILRATIRCGDICTFYLQRPVQLPKITWQRKKSHTTSSVQVIEPGQFPYQGDLLIQRENHFGIQERRNQGWFRTTRHIPLPLPLIDSTSGSLILDYFSKVNVFFFRPNISEVSKTDIKLALSERSEFKSLEEFRKKRQTIYYFS